MSIIIREERKEDYKATENMVMRTFWNIHGPGCNEHLLVRLIRNSKDYLPQISRVAEQDGKIIGAIYYTKACVVDKDRTHDIITFGPLAIEPALQNSGTGRMLLEETFKLAREAGYSGIAIYGEPKYYPKRGFEDCKKYGITDPEGNNFDALMCYPLDKEKFSQVHGKLYESTCFDNADDEAAINEISKEFPSYPKIKIQDGFLQIYDGRFGEVQSIEENTCTIKYWELTLPAAAKEGVKAGDIVIFKRKRDGSAEIVQVFDKNKVLVEE